jgi:lysine-specific demethylase 3
VMCHVQRAPGSERGPHPPARCGDAPAQAPGFNGAGALWDLFRRQDIPTLRAFVQDVLAGKVPGVRSFVKDGKVLSLADVVDPVHDQSIMLTEKHRAAMRAAPYNLHPWVVEQYEFEAVLIPAACVHEVRNLRSCIKTALDFVSPESVGHNLAQREERRVLARAERTERGLPEVDKDEEVGMRHYHDKLQVSNMVMHGLQQAVDILEARGR